MVNEEADKSTSAESRERHTAMPRAALAPRLAPLAAATLLVVFAAFCVWQALVIARESQVQDVVYRARGRAVAQIDKVLQAQQARIGKAMADTALVADLAPDTAAGRAAAAVRAMELLPHVNEILFFSPSLDEVLSADYRQFGYAKAARLMQLQSSHTVPLVDVVRRGHDHRLAQALPVMGSTGAIVAYAWVEWPLTPLVQQLMLVNPGAGRLALRLGSGSEGLLLAQQGRSNNVGQADAGRQIAGSQLWVTAAMPRAPIMLPHYWILAVVLALFALIGAGVLLWPRFRSNRINQEEEIPVSPTSTPTETQKTARTPAPVAAPVEVDPGIFRAYDIRGVVGKQLTAEVAHALGQAIGSEMRDKGLSEIVVGRDGRLSGPELAGALADGLRAAGVDVIDVGMVPTPLVYFATFHFNCGSGVAVTGSHNPPDYNGFKIVIGGETLSGEAITALCTRIQEKNLVKGGSGNYRQVDILPDYIDRIASDVQTERPLKVVADAGNGIAGAVAPELLEAIGCEVVPLYCEVDGHFPNHHPDPSDPHNLEDLKQAIVEHDADLGVAFDGDGDRLGVVTRAGEIIYPDRLLMLFARDVLARNPGATIIYDVKCTGHLDPEVRKAGGSPLMWRTGHSLIKAKMRETEAALAGEMSGHFFFRERWYGFDDGLYSAARLLEILAGDHDRRTPDAILASLPNGVSTPELKVDMVEEGANHAFIQRFQEQATFEGARLTTIDGVRADWPDGWGLVRASNTTPVLVLRFDADSEAALERIKQRFREQLLAVEPSLDLPF
ncbi:MAG TPA: phosphomannomutase/phosphoglucomutase [Rhodanobacteraceae bacterium]|nr:phosphomannomutase/phosphoglucomutase [Rhodanobacteraceae bacterium]